MIVAMFEGLFLTFCFFISSFSFFHDLPSGLNCLVFQDTLLQVVFYHIVLSESPSLFMKPVVLDNS